MAHHTPESSNRALAQAIETLREHGHRITAPRRAILGILAREHGPFTVEEIHRRLPEGKCDLVTVYRTLAAMEGLEVVQRCDFGDNAYRYEFNHAGHHHHHVICRTCRSVRTMNVCVADALERTAREMGYAQVTHTLEIFGICQACQGK